VGSAEDWKILLGMKGFARGESQRAAAGLESPTGQTPL
jgi:hypothetical protein